MAKYNKYMDESEDDFEFEEDRESVSKESVPEEEDIQFIDLGEEEDVHSVIRRQSDYEPEIPAWSQENKSEQDLLLEETEEEEEEELAQEESMDEEQEAGPSFKKPILIVGAIAVVLIAIIVVLFFIKDSEGDSLFLRMIGASENHERITKEAFFNIKEGEIAAYLDGVRLEDDDHEQIVFRENHYYLSESFVSQVITDKFYYDRELDELLYTTDANIWYIPYDAQAYQIGEETYEYAEVIAMKEDGITYLSYDFVMEMDGYGLYSYVEKDPDCLYFVTEDQKYQTIGWDEENEIVRVHLNADKHSLVVEEFAPNEEISQNWYVDETEAKDEKWAKVANPNGMTGYVKREMIADASKEELSFACKETVSYPNQLRDHDIVLAWHGVYDVQDNKEIAELTAHATSLTTVSPTWYKVVDEKGKVSVSPEDENTDQTPLVDPDYVDYIHGLGMEIWPLISDFTSSAYGWDEKQMLSSYTARQNIIEFLMDEATTYGYDGINVDFEKVPKEAGDDYIEFIRELSIACRKKALVLSVDNYVPREHTAYYHRDRQAECVDYVIIMGYDEHWAGCEEAGSTASLPFVTEGLDASLALVPKEKLLMGIPFYCRLWVTQEDGTLNSVTRGMSTYEGLPTAMEAVEAHGLTPIWDETVGQNVAIGVDPNDGKTYSIWIEDADSMRVRMKAIREREIAGVAGWSLGAQTDDVWDIIKK